MMDSFNNSTENKRCTITYYHITFHDFHDCCLYTDEHLCDAPVVVIPYLFFTLRTLSSVIFDIAINWASLYTDDSFLCDAQVDFHWKDPFKLMIRFVCDAEWCCLAILFLIIIFVVRPDVFSVFEALGCLFVTRLILVYWLLCKRRSAVYWEFSNQNGFYKVCPCTEMFLSRYHKLLSHYTDDSHLLNYVDQTFMRIRRLYIVI